MLSIVIPAHNEANYIAPTLESLLAQDDTAPEGVHVIVAANGCSDETVSVAGAHADRFAARLWRLTVLDVPLGNKVAALNAADATIAEGNRMYMDADVICSPPLLGQIADVLDRPEPVYASGKFIVTPSEDWVNRHYVNLWTKLPFMTTGVPGGGLFAVNAAARARWKEFPNVIADDSFARLQFRPEERAGVPAQYVTPLPDGFGALVRVRRRWNAGMRQLVELHPELFENDDKPPMSVGDHLQLFFGQPVSYVTYVSVALAVKIGSYDRSNWGRGR